MRHWPPAAVVSGGTALLLLVAAVATMAYTDPSHGAADRQFMFVFAAMLGVLAMGSGVLALASVRRRRAPVRHHRSGIAGAALMLIGLVGTVWSALGQLEPSLTWIVLGGLAAGALLVVRSEVATDHAVER